MSASPSPRSGRRPDPALHTLWQQRLRRFEQSGLSALAFCTEHGLSLPSFYAWKRRLRLAEEEAWREASQRRAELIQKSRSLGLTPEEN
jgi:hypothetical protein